MVGIPGCGRVVYTPPCMPPCIPGLYASLVHPGRYTLPGTVTCTRATRARAGSLRSAEKTLLVTELKVGGSDSRESDLSLLRINPSGQGNGFKRTNKPATESRRKQRRPESLNPSKSDVGPPQGPEPPFHTPRGGADEGPGPGPWPVLYPIFVKKRQKGQPRGCPGSLF